jgi:hypothetical protein
MKLAIKEIFPSFNAFHAAWFCHNHALDKKYRVLENKARKCFRANCFSAPATKWRGAESVCHCHIYATPMKSQDGCFTGEWIINSFHSGHTCSDSECARKRQYKCSLLESVSPALAAHIPNKKQRTGATQQVRDIARKAGGIQLKASQAYNVVTAKRQDGVKVHIGQYFLLSSYFIHLENADPDGTFILDCETHDSAWLSESPQFQRCYASFSFTKHAWNVGSIHVITSDGTFTTSPVFKHIVLLAVSHDGNNELVLLAYAICDVENERNWTWFGQQLAKDFEGCVT